MELFVVRHGETQANRDAIIQGQNNTQLTNTGWQQACLLAARLAPYTFDAVYSSDLDRAIKTALTIAPDAVINQDRRLREWMLGDWQGVPIATLKQTCPDLFNEFSTAHPTFRVPGGESLQELNERVQQFLADMVTRHADARRVLVVTHGGVLRAMLRIIPNDIPSNRNNNCSLNRFQYIDGHWCVLEWNNISHLSQPQS